MSSKPTSASRPRGAKTSKAKSHKADGTPKKRWSAAERAARGHGPRTSGGRPRSERSDRPERDDRPERTDRFERPERNDRADRGDRFDRPQRSRDDRPSWSRDDRPQRSDRPSWSRDDRPQRSDRPRVDRDDRPQRSGRDDRRPWSRDDRPQRSDRPRFDRDDRPQRSWRDDRPQRSDRDDRPQRSDRDDRPQRSERPTWSRDDRPQRSERPTWSRDDRPQRDERPSRDDRARRDDRPRFDRDDRKRFDRDDRTPRSSDDRPRFDRDDRPQRSREDRPSRWSDDHGHRPRGSRPPADQHGGRRHESRPHRFAERHHGPREERPEWQQITGYEAEAQDQMSWSEAAAVDVEALAPAAEGNGFAALGLPTVLVDALAAQQITTPFPIQAATIPDALAGRDVLGRGQTGSGKTLGFGLPMLSRLLEGRRGRTRAVVLVPTRELAMQVADVLSPLASTLGLSVVLIAGGMAYGPQVKALGRGVDVVVATPGRLIDLMDQGDADLSDVEVAVLDEADHMADLGFLPAVRRILDSVPPGGQRLLFSATLDRGIDKVVREYLSDPVTHEVDSGQASVSTMSHHVYQVKPYEKQTITAEVANRDGRTLVFARTQRGADRIAGQLREAGVMAGALHGGLTQGARTRILGAFKNGTVPVVVATDVAARGIHVDEVSLVLQVDPAMGPKDYLHRAGRTARAGGEGVVVTLALPHQRHEVARLVKQAGVRLMAEEVTADDENVYRATGARKPSRPAIEDHEYEALIAPPVKVRSSRPGGRGGRSGGHRGGRPAGGGRGRSSWGGRDDRRG